jgi:hypothetical protein
MRRLESDSDRRRIWRRYLDHAADRRAAQTHNHDDASAWV